MKNAVSCLFQAMVTRYSSISMRKLSSAPQILTANKCMVATRNYNAFYKIAKQYILAGVLGANAQVHSLKDTVYVHLHMFMQV